MAINFATISGNITRDAEIRKAGNTPCVNFSVAVNERYQKGETWETRTNYIDCVMFGARAEKLSQYLKKGAKVAVSGALRYSAWEKDGQKRSKVEIAVSDVEFFGAPKQQKPDDEYVPFDD